MDATSRRFGSLLEWICAAGCAAGGVLLLSGAIDNLRSVPAVVPGAAQLGPNVLMRNGGVTCTPGEVCITLA